MTKAWYIHKHEVAMQYGGPEEGGWWYTVGVPVKGFKVEHFTDEEEAYARCRQLNQQERERAEREEHYDFSSVLAYRSNHYSYTVEEFPVPMTFAESRPHYE